MCDPRLENRVRTATEESMQDRRKRADEAAQSRARGAWKRAGGTEGEERPGQCRAERVGCTKASPQCT